MHGRSVLSQLGDPNVQRRTPVYREHICLQNRLTAPFFLHLGGLWYQSLHYARFFIGSGCKSNVVTHQTSVAFKSKQ